MKMEQLIIKLKYDTECSYCHQQLYLGEEALWIPDRRKVFCHECSSLPEEIRSKDIIRNNQMDFCDCCSRRLITGELKELRQHGGYKRSYCLKCSELDDEKIDLMPCKHKKIRAYSSSHRTQHGGPSYTDNNENGHCMRCQKSMNGRDIAHMHDVLIFETNARYGPKGGFSSSDFKIRYKE